MSTDCPDALERRIGYHFVSGELLRQALTHASVTTDNSRNNERLEFLGDRVLALLVADLLLQHYPDAPEGELALRLNALVRRETCAAVAQEIGLGNYLVLAASEAASGGREKPAILSDACEALIGALHQDGGLAAAQNFVHQWWTPRLAGVEIAPGDAKSELQEWSQARKLGTPAYRVINREGPDHAPVFIIEVELPGYAPQRGAGNSKREAERTAAQAMLDSVRAQPLTMDQK